MLTWNRNILNYIFGKNLKNHAKSKEYNFVCFRELVMICINWLIKILANSRKKKFGSLLWCQKYGFVCRFIIISFIFLCKWFYNAIITSDRILNEKTWRKKIKDSILEKFIRNESGFQNMLVLLGYSVRQKMADSAQNSETNSTSWSLMKLPYQVLYTYV